MRKRKTAGAVTNSLASKVGTTGSSLEEQAMIIDCLASQSLLGSAPYTNSGLPAVSQMYENTQMDVDHQEENVAM